jgi:uncharacterized membrane protein
LNAEMAPRRLTFVAIGSALFWLGLQIQGFGDLASNPQSVFISFAVYGSAFTALLVAVNDRWAASKWASVMGAAMVSVTLIAAVFVQITVSQPNYGTDALALSHVAAQLVIDGENPYAATIDLNELEGNFKVPVPNITQKLDGEYITRVTSYPALHILVFVPSLLLGIDDLRFTVLLFEIGAMLLIWAFAPWSLKTLALIPLLANADLFLYFTGGSVTDWIWVLPLLGMTIALARGRSLWAAVLYGVATAIKQQPWVLAPFLGVWIWRSTNGSPTARARQVVGFGGIVFGVFASINLPFVVWGFHDWVTGMLLPVVQDLIPHGQGLSLLTQIGIAPLDKSWYFQISSLVLAYLTAIYYLFFERIRWALFLFPILFLWLGARAYQSYWIYFIPLLILALMIDARVPSDADIETHDD